MEQNQQPEEQPHERRRGVIGDDLSSEAEARITARLEGLHDPRAGRPERCADRDDLRKEFEDGQAAGRMYAAIETAGEKCQAAGRDRDLEIKNIASLMDVGERQIAGDLAAIMAYRDTRDGVEPHEFGDAGISERQADGVVTALSRDGGEVDELGLTQAEAKALDDHAAHTCPDEADGPDFDMD